MEAGQNPPPLAIWEQGRPLPQWFRRPIPWWIALLIFGDSKPLPDKIIQTLKIQWEHEHDKLGAIYEMRERFKELHASTLDNFVRLTVVGAVVAAIVAANQQIAPFLVGDKTPFACLVASWTYLACTGIAVICIMLMVMPKYKEWREPTERDVGAGIHVLYSRRHEHWAEFLRLNHRYAHRQQLVTFERRVQHIGCVMTMLAYTAMLLAFVFE